MVVAVLGHLLLCVALHFQMPGGRLWDVFHYGEYFASLNSLGIAQAPAFPLFVHGALDHLPASIARSMFGPDHHFFATWLIYRMLDLLAGWLLIATLAELAAARAGSALLIIGGGMLASSLVGYRDVMLLACIVLFLYRQRMEGPIMALLLEAALGASAAFGMYWSYDRGLVAVCAIGAVCLPLAIWQRRYRYAWLAAGVTMLALALADERFSLDHHYRNILLLIETGSQWGLGTGLRPMALTAFLAFADLIALVALATHIRLHRRDWRVLSSGAMLAILTLFFFRIGSNRADLVHIAWGLLGPLLIGAYLFGRQADRTPSKVHAWVLWGGMAIAPLTLADRTVLPFVPMMALLALGAASFLQPTAAIRTVKGLLVTVLALPLVWAGWEIGTGATRSRYGWTGYLVENPGNAALSPPSLVWVAQRLSANRPDCLFDFTNSGLLYGLTGLPSCTRFVYPVYATPRHQDDIIEGLKRTQPFAIVHQSATSSFRIDGRAMPQRLPKVADYLSATYRHQECSPVFCIRYLARPQ